MSGELAGCQQLSCERLSIAEISAFGASEDNLVKVLVLLLKND